MKTCEPFRGIRADYQNLIMTILVILILKMKYQMIILKMIILAMIMI